MSRQQREIKNHETPNRTGNQLHMDIGLCHSKRFLEYLILFFPILGVVLGG